MSSIFGSEKKVSSTQYDTQLTASEGGVIAGRDYYGIEGEALKALTGAHTTNFNTLTGAVSDNFAELVGATAEVTRRMENIASDALDTADAFMSRAAGQADSATKKAFEAIDTLRTDPGTLAERELSKNALYIAAAAILALVVVMKGKK